MPEALKKTTKKAERLDSLTKAQPEPGDRHRSVKIAKTHDGRMWRQGQGSKAEPRTTKPILTTLRDPLRLLTRSQRAQVRSVPRRTRYHRRTVESDPAWGNREASGRLVRSRRGSPRALVMHRRGRKTLGVLKMPLWRIWLCVMALWTMAL